MVWQAVEIFSGAGQVSQAFRNHGYKVCQYDLELGGRPMDFTTPAGFASGSQIACNI